MTEQEYINAFTEGAITADKSQVIVYLLSSLYQVRRQCVALQEQVAVMDDVARDAGITVKCRRCGEYYDIPCELSEFDPEYSYCGSGHGGAYHCSP